MDQNRGQISWPFTSLPLGRIQKESRRLPHLPWPTGFLVNLATPPDPTTPGAPAWGEGRKRGTLWQTGFLTARPSLPRASVSHQTPRCKAAAFQA